MLPCTADLPFDQSPFLPITLSANTNQANAAHEARKANIAKGVTALIGQHEGEAPTDKPQPIIASEVEPVFITIYIYYEVHTRRTK